MTRRPHARTLAFRVVSPLLGTLGTLGAGTALPAQMLGVPVL